MHFFSVAWLQKVREALQVKTEYECIRDVQAMRPSVFTVATLNVEQLKSLAGLGLHSHKGLLIPLPTAILLSWLIHPASL